MNRYHIAGGANLLCALIWLSLFFVDLNASWAPLTLILLSGIAACCYLAAAVFWFLRSRAEKDHAGELDDGDSE